MSSEQKLPPPNELYASPNSESPIGWSYSDTPLDNEFVTYTLRPSAAEQKYAALVEAVKAAIEMAKTAERNVSNSNLGMSGAAGDCREIYSGLSLALALAQQDQPAGEWITINEDGSNLPEYVEEAWWCLVLSDHDEPAWRSWGYPTNWHYVATLYDSSVRIIAYWSIPHIDRRPDIPAYTAPNER